MQLKKTLDDKMHDIHGKGNIAISGKRKQVYVWSLHGLSLNPVILYSILEGLTLILKFFSARLACLNE